MKTHISLIRQQEEKDCGAACLSMIAQYYGKKLPLATVAEAIKVDQYGASIYGLIDGAKQFELVGTAMEGTAEEFLNDVREEKIKLPVIARVVNRFYFEHYVVVTGIKGNRIYYCDPGEGHMRVTCEKFAQSFLGQIVAFEKAEGFIEENKRKGTLKEFISLITRQKGLVAVIGILSMLISMVGLAGTFLFQFLIDCVLPEVDCIGANCTSDHVHIGSVEAFAVLITAVGVLYILRFLIQLIRGKLLAFMTKRINLSLMLGYYNHVVDLKMDFFGNHKTGDIISRFSDASKIQEALANVTLTLMIDVVMVIFCGIVLHRQSVTLFYVTVIILALYVLISSVFIRPLDRRNRQMMLENAQLNSYLKESVDGIQTVKAFQAEKTVKERTKVLLSNLQNYGVKHAMLSLSKDAMIEFTTSVGTLCLLWIGTINIVNGNMTLGTLMTFYTLLGYFLNPIQNVMELQSSLQSAVVAAGRLRDILDRSIESTEDKKESFNNGRISFENVVFRYGNRSLVLNDLSIDIEQGQHIAIVGTSGCGKTTVTKLLMRFYTPESGQIKIAGKAIEDISVDELRKNIAYVPQETFLFSDTIRNNLLLGNERNIPDAEIYDILNICGCDFIKELTFGLDTVLEENGLNLSGGQRQRLAIARALLRSPKILILDEATSNLDSISERKLQQALHTLCPNMTVIMVAHRMNAIRKCDKIIVLNQGKLIEAGTHDQLMHISGCYANFWNHQG